MRNDGHVPLPSATANGEPSLNDRVRELRLAGRLDSAKGGSSGTAWLPWLLCLLMAVAWAGLGVRFYRGLPAAPTEPGPGSPSQPAASPGATTGPSAQAGPALAEGAVVLESKGYIIPAHQITLSPIEVFGKIIELNIEEGKRFNKGDVLARIDSTPFEAEMAEAEAQVASARAKLVEVESGWSLEIKQAEADLAEAQAQMEEAQLVYDVARTSGSAAARLELQQAKKKLDASKQRVEALKQKLELTKGEPRKQRIEALKRDLQAAEARRARSRWRLNNCVIRAPVTGTILSKRAEIGNLLNSAAFTASIASGLGDMADLADLEVDLEVQERDLAKVKVHQECRVRADAYPDRIYEGYVDRLMPIANRSRGVLPIRVKIIVPADEEQGSYLRPEMGVVVSFVNRQIEKDKIRPSQEPTFIDPKPEGVKNGR